MLHKSTKILSEKELLRAKKVNSHNVQLDRHKVQLHTAQNLLRATKFMNYFTDINITGKNKEMNK